jgi:uncharacterized membrane protein
MNKKEFLKELENRLALLPSDDVEASLEYYSEMIDERIEEGMDEESAVASLPTPEKAAADVISEMSIPKLVKAKIKAKRTLRLWEIVLIILTLPIWLSLILAVVSVIFSVYISIWAVVVSFWAVGISIFAMALASLASGLALLIIAGNAGAGIVFFGAAIFFAGIGIFGFWVCKELTVFICKLSKLILKWIKNCFIKKEA